MCQEKHSQLRCFARIHLYINLTSLIVFHSLIGSLRQCVLSVSLALYLIHRWRFSKHGTHHGNKNKKKNRIKEYKDFITLTSSHLFKAILFSCKRLTATSWDRRVVSLLESMEFACILSGILLVNSVLKRLKTKSRNRKIIREKIFSISRREYIDVLIQIWFGVQKILRLVPILSL